MGYVTNNLMPNETVVHVGKVHWFIFVPGIVLMFFAFVFLAGGDGTAEEEFPAAFIGVMLMFFAVFSLLKAFIFKISTELAVTSKRVIAKTGFIRRNTVELNHSKVESYNVDQSIMGRIFGFGTIFVCGTGGGKTPVPNIDDPLAFRRQAMSVVDGLGAPRP